MLCESQLYISISVKFVVIYIYILNHLLCYIARAITSLNFKNAFHYKTMCFENSDFFLILCGNHVLLV